MPVTTESKHLIGLSKIISDVARGGHWCMSGNYASPCI